MGDTTEVSAKVDNFRLWFRVPAGYKVSETASPFLSAALSSGDAERGKTCY